MKGLADYDALAFMEERGTLLANIPSSYPNAQTWIYQIE